MSQFEMKNFWKFAIAFLIELSLFCGAAYGQGMPVPAGSSNQTFTVAPAPEVESYLAKIRGDKTALRNFLQQMPKGADLHSHLSGTASPGRLLELAAESTEYRYLVRVPNNESELSDSDIGKAYAFVAVPQKAEVPKEEKATFVPVATLLNPQTDEERQQREAYERALTISPDESNPNNEFFNYIFRRNDLVTGDTEILKKLLADVVYQSHDERLSYVEIMFTPFPKIIGGSDDDEYKVINLATARDYVNSLIAVVEQANQKFPESERVFVRFLLSFPRTRPKLFTQLPVSFQLASDPALAARAIAGINLVGNEYSDDPNIGQEIAPPNALEDFILSLRRIYPGVRLSIHAGENQKWDWHIRDSILLGAERIGHGVNLDKFPRPNKKSQTESPEAAIMRREGILIEACLTSNNLLLKIPFKAHPFLKYLRSGIPVSLSTDNTGVFNTSITEEYARAVESHPDLSWRELKQMARFSLDHAFVDDDIKAQLVKRWEEQIQALEASVKL